MANQQLPPPVQHGDHLFERWGVKLDEDSNGTASSGLLPMFPTLLEPFGLGEDLWYTHQRALQEAGTASDPLPKSIPRPSGKQLDELFFTEYWQQINLFGIRTWELPMLNQGLVGTSFWQEVMMLDLSSMGLPQVGITIQDFPDVDLVTVDESRWNKALSRGRWYDLASAVLQKDAQGNPTQKRRWSVDDNALWHELRIVLEMANRLMHHVVYGDWLYALLEGKAVPVPNVEAFVKGKNGINFFMPRRIVSPGEDGTGPRQPDIGVARRLWATVEQMSEWIIWSFFDPRDVDKYGSIDRDDLTAAYCENATARLGVQPIPLNTVALPHPQDPQIFVDIKVNAMILETLLKVSTTPEEVASKHITRAHLALTVIHELMHALHDVKTMLDAGVTFFQMEPIYGNDESAELGWSQEQTLQGQVTSVGPANVLVPDSKFLSRAGPALRYASSWITHPRNRGLGQQLTYSHNGEPRYPPTGYLVEVDPLPTYWSSRLQSQNYWDSCVNVYGLTALAPKPVVRAHMRHVKCFQVRFYHAQRVAQPSPHRHKPITYLYGQDRARFLLEEEQTYQYMEFRKKLWKNLRPWYKQSYKLWQRTPYSMVDYRLCIDQFRRAVAERNRKAAESVVFALHTKLTATVMDIVKSNGQIVFDFNRHPALWPFIMIEIMMHACLPYDWNYNQTMAAASVPPPGKKKPKTRPVYHFANLQHLPNRWLPSQHALKAGAFFTYPASWSRPISAQIPVPPPAGAANAPPPPPDVTNPYDIQPPLADLRNGVPSLTSAWPTPANRPATLGVFGARLEMLLRVETDRVTGPMSAYPIPKSLWDALITEYKSLHRQNLALGENNSNGAWLDFDFNFPEYDAEELGTEWICLDHLSRPMDYETWSQSHQNMNMFGGAPPTLGGWASAGWADPDLVEFRERVVGMPGGNGVTGGAGGTGGGGMGADMPEVYYPSDGEISNGPDVWPQWVHKHVQTAVPLGGTRAGMGMRTSTGFGTGVGTAMWMGMGFGAGAGTGFGTGTMTGTGVGTGFGTGFGTGTGTPAWPGSTGTGTTGNGMTGAPAWPGTGTGMGTATGSRPSVPTRPSVTTRPGAGPRRGVGTRSGPRPGVGTRTGPSAGARGGARGSARGGTVTPRGSNHPTPYPQRIQRTAQQGTATQQGATAANSGLDPDVAMDGMMP